MPGHEHLVDLSTRCREATAEVRSLFEHLTAEQLSWKPDANTWSILQCIEHLVTTGRLYLPPVREALERVRENGVVSVEPFRFTLFGKWFVTMAGPEVRWKVKTPPAFAPNPELTDLSVLERFVEVQEGVEALIREADGWPLNTRKFRSPVSRLVRLTLGEGLTLLVWHTWRHVNQAVALTRHPEFPSA